MMRSLFSGVSGLKSHQTRMDVIGNNIANVNTIGFKSSRVTFADTLYQTQSGAAAPTGTVGGTNPKQIGLGVGVASVDLLFNDASPQATGKNTDLALSGNGLFVVSRDAGGKDKYYTRAGNFSFDANYNYVVPGSGYHVVGWNADENGSIDTKGTPTGIQIKDAMRSMGAKATTTISYKGNMNSSVPTITSIRNQTGNLVASPAKVDGVTNTSLTLTLSDGTTQTVTAKSNYEYRTKCSMPITTIANVYDSLGNLHKVPFLFTKVPGTGTPPLKYDEWEVSLSPATTSGGALDPLGQCSIKEDDGSWTTVKMTTKTLKFDQSGKYTSGAGDPELTLENGAGSTSPTSPSPVPTMTATVDLKSLTQYSGSDTIKADYDGHSAGTLKEINTDQSGILTGTYTNGEKRALAQVAVAQFDNAPGLTKAGANLYTESNNSGTANIKTVSSLGLTLTPSALEMSNVDVANEFADMVVTQRGFQSNSKIITVGDEMLETVINMKR